MGGRLGALPRSVCLALVAVVAFAGCDSDTAEQATSVSAAATVATPPAPSRQPPAQIDAVVGDVRVEEGPFTDRVVIQRLALDPGTSPTVRGRIRNTVDVSDVIVLEIQADFYDRRGNFLGSGRQVFTEVAAPPDGPFLRFAIRPDRPAPAATAAVVSIPQLVNE